MQSLTGFGCTTILWVSKIIFGTSQVTEVRLSVCLYADDDASPTVASLHYRTCRRADVPMCPLTSADMEAWPCGPDLSGALHLRTWL